MKKLALAALGAALVTTSFAPAPVEAKPRHWRHHHGWHGGWGAGAAGLATGLIVGGAIASAASPYGYGYGYGPSYYAPPAVTYAPAPTVRSRANPNCVMTTRYDQTGMPFEWWDCN